MAPHAAERLQVQKHERLLSRVDFIGHDSSLLAFDCSRELSACRGFIMDAPAEVSGLYAFHHSHTSRLVLHFFSHCVRSPHT